MPTIAGDPWTICAHSGIEFPSSNSNGSTYDAWYVALAEALDLPLATLDARMSRAPGPECEFLVPPG